MYKIAVIGDKESVIGFSCVGVDSFTVTDKNQAAVMLKSLSSDGYGIIFITEALASDLKEEIIKYRDNPEVSVVLIPGVSGNTGEGMLALNKSIERAVGSQII